MGTHDKPEDGRRRVTVEAVLPEVDGGRFPIKRVVGDALKITAHLVADGHDVLACELRYQTPGSQEWQCVRMESLGNDEYATTIACDDIGRWKYTVVAWIDEFATWHHGFERKLEANAERDVDLAVGAELVAAAAARAKGKDKTELGKLAKLLAKKDAKATRTEKLLAASTAALVSKYPRLDLQSEYPHVLELVVDRERAVFSSWYEFFPRSTGKSGEHGTFKTAKEMLPYVAEMGFNVVYLPPIHPIGKAHRKGKNNSLTCGPDEPGSPWAIGGKGGGHFEVHPELGTMKDFLDFQSAAHELGLELALDIAFQASPDHPWVKEHPEWFRQLPDGSIQYAENPPKKYQDIYPIDFESSDWKALWDELCRVFDFWADKGVRIFRVDNPHTKSFVFWHWCIDELKAKYPDLIFLAEAFTRPKMMYGLAKRGFSQSYTYYTWRNSAAEMRAYLEELTRTNVAEYARPNFWPNTPDILPDHLMGAAFGAFASRLIMAATLSSNYGIYGPAYELMDNTPRPGSGEYLDNEKYQLKDWDLNKHDSLRHLIRRINEIRAEHPALQQTRSIDFHTCENDQLLCYSKRAGDDVILVVVSFDPHRKQVGTVHLNLEALGVGGGSFKVRDLLGGSSYTWQGSANYVELEPWSMPAHIFTLQPL